MKNKRNISETNVHEETKEYKNKHYNKEDNLCGDSSKKSKSEFLASNSTDSKYKFHLHSKGLK